MISAFTQVWTALVTWLATTLQTVTGFFWTAGTGSDTGSLTFMGVMAVIMAGISLVLLVFNLIRSFFPMRG